jgi:hypothetical protein
MSHPQPDLNHKRLRAGMVWLEDHDALPPGKTQEQIKAERDELLSWLHKFMSEVEFEFWFAGSKQ